MGKWFALKNDILYNQSIKARTKIVLAILSHHKNNSSIIKTTHAKLDKWTNIQHSDRYLKELISLGYIQKIKDGEYKMIYRVRFQDKKKSQFTKQEYDEFVEKYTKIEYDHIFSYKPEDVIDYYIITNILKMNKFNIDDINKIDITIFLSSKNDKSPWDSIEEVNEVLSKLSQKSFLKYEVTLQCLLPIPNEEEWEQKETAPEEPEADNLDKEVSDNIIQKADPEITSNEDKTKEEPIKKSEHEEKYMKLIKQYIKVTNRPVKYDKALIHFKKAEEVGKTYDDIKAIVKYLAKNDKSIYFLNTTSIQEAGIDIQQLLKRIEDAEVNKDKPARFVKYFYQLKEKDIPTTSIKSNLELAEKLINTYKLGNKKIKNFLGFEKPEISLFVEYCAEAVDIFNYLKNEQTTDKIYEQLMCLDNHYVSNWSRKEIDEYIKSIKEGN